MPMQEAAVFASGAFLCTMEKERLSMRLSKIDCLDEEEEEENPFFGRLFDDFCLREDLC